LYENMVSTNFIFVKSITTPFVGNINRD